MRKSRKATKVAQEPAPEVTEEASPEPEAAPVDPPEASEAVEHLIDKHGYTKEYVNTTTTTDTHLRLQHTRLHEDATAKNLDHTHEAGDATVLPHTRIWVGLDIAAEGPDAMVIVQEVLSKGGAVVAWRVINPASEADQEEFKRIGEAFDTAFSEVAGQDVLPFEEVADDGTKES